jgi:RND family efflux transporter MFP subunit
MEQRTKATPREAASISRLSNCFSPESKPAQICGQLLLDTSLSSTPHFAVSTRHSVTSRIERNSRAFCYLIFSTRHLNATLEKHENVEKFITLPSLFCRFRLTRQTQTGHSHFASAFRAVFLDGSAPDLLGSRFALLRESTPTLKTPKPGAPFRRAVEVSAALFDLASVSLACRDQDTLVKTFVARVGAATGAQAVFVWLNNGPNFGHSSGSSSDSPSGDSLLACRARWSENGERFNTQSEGAAQGILAEVVKSGEVKRLNSQALAANGLSHLDKSTRQRVKSAVYAPLPGAQGIKGVVEVLGTRAGEFTADQARFIEEASRFVGQALTNLEALESERNLQLATLDRLTALYDIGRTFTSTLELKELLPIVAGKIRDLSGAGACNVWLIDRPSNELHLAEQAGSDPTSEPGSRVSASEGLLAEVAQQADSKLVTEPPEEAALQERLQAAGDFEMHCWMAAPLRKDDEVLGVIELINKVDGSSFDEEELFLLSSVSEQAAVALHNANLLESERKVFALDALLKISKEITSTLDLDHVLTTVVHQAATVVPFDKCVIGFFDRGRFILGAVSGETEVPSTREMDELRDRLEWVANQSDAVSADLYSDGWHAHPEDARAQIVSVLEAHDYGGFYALPLRDEQGALGAMALLSSDADFLTTSHKELLSILANQVSVAIRNAQLYQQVPLANILQPFAQRKAKFLSAVPHGRLRVFLERAGAVALVLILVPWPVRVGTNATVVPARRRVVSAMEGGVARAIYVHEGQMVQPGQLLAQIDDSDSVVRLAQAQAALSQSQHDLEEAEFRNDAATAGQARTLADLHAIEVRYGQERVSDAQLRAPIAGIVVTPRIEERTGTMVKAGEAFCEIVESDRMAAEMSVPENDLGLVRAGKPAALKLNAFPTTTFQGTVERIGAKTQSDAGEQYFLVRAVFENPGGQARDGMVGRARIRAGGGWFGSGWYPVGYALLRDPFRWFWQKAWVWTP